MQYLNMRNAIGLIMTLALFIGGAPTAFAVGTVSGTNITNTATVDYEVGTDPRTATGSDGGFLVDNKVDLTVANVDANTLNVTPGAANQVRTYTVTNTGNTPQGYSLSTNATTANIPMGSVEIWLDTNGNGTWDGPGPGNDTLYGGGNAFDLDPNGVIGTDDVRTVFVVADTPAAAVDANQDVIHLKAEAREATTGAALTAAGSDTALVDIVFADGIGTDDGNRDGVHSASVTYTVVSAALSVVKTESTTDPFASDFHIPGAIVQYLIRVTNSGAGTVDSNTVVLNDPIPANTKLCVDAACGGLPTFAQGTPTSALTAATFQYSTAASPNECDDLSFTGYVPTTVVDGDGANPNITCVRQAPTGDMAGSGGYFDIQFFVVIE